jgi:hypothetical protein
MSLLIKWRWRLLQNDHAFWKEILGAKYAMEATHKVHWIGVSLQNRASVWWKDICGIDIREGEFIKPQLKYLEYLVKT